jgi:hypothetical protein
LGAVSQYQRRVYLALAVLSGLAAASWPVWGFTAGTGRPDRVCGLALGVAAGVLRLAWAFFLARRLATTIPTPSRYATLRITGYVPPAAALAAAGFVEGIDIYAAALGVVLVSAAQVAGSVLVLREIERAPGVREGRWRQDRAGGRAEQAPR